MAGAGCILEEHRRELLENEYVLSFARYCGIKANTALTWIQSWLLKTKKDFLLEAAKNNAKYKFTTYDAVVENRRQQLLKTIKPTSETFARRFNTLHKDLNTGLLITDALLLIEHLCYELYKDYNTNGIYNSLEEFLSGGEIGLYDEIYSILSEALIPDENTGGYYMPVYFVNDDHPQDAIQLTSKQVEMLQKVLNRSNYDTLWHLFKIYAKSTLGVTVDLRDTVSTNLEDIGEYLSHLDKGETDETTQFNYEESPKDSWQEVKEFIKPMKQLSKEVRRMFSHIPQIDKNGKIALSTFGVPRFESPHVIHRNVAKILLGVRNESDMIKLLKKAEAGYSLTNNRGENEIKYGNRLMGYILQLVDYTVSSNKVNGVAMSYGITNSLRTKLFQDMQKVGMPYAIAKIKRKGKEIFTRLTFINTASNQIGNQLWLGYRLMLSSENNNVASEYTIFEKNGDLKEGATKSAYLMMNHLKVSDIKKSDELSYTEYAEERTKDFFNQTTVNRQLYVVLTALRELGIPFDAGNISKLLRSSRSDKYSLVSNLYDVFECIYSRGEDKTSMLSALTGSNWKVDKAMSQILRIANLDNMMAQSTFRMSGSYMNPTKGFVEYLTGQLRGFLSDMFEDIQHAKEQTLDESNITRDGKIKINYVHKYIEDHFFQDPMMVEYAKTTDKKGNLILDDQGNPIKPRYKYHKAGYPVIRNPWLDELWRSASNIENLKSSNSFINNFKHYLFVGSEKDATNFGESTYNSDWKVWEDFNGMQHMSLLMNAYVLSYRSNEIKGVYKDEYADYPTFILGDSGKLKFIRSKRYKVRNDKGESVMKHLKKSVMQEIDFAKNAYDFLKLLVSEGKKPIAQLKPSKLMMEYPNGKLFYKVQTFHEINNLLYLKAISNGVDFTQSQEAVAHELGVILQTNLDEWLENIMKDRLAEFKKKCEKEGILKPEKVKKEISDSVTVEIDTYPQLPLGKDSGYSWLMDGTEESELKNKEELNRFLEDFYYNSTLAMISLIQITTLSPAFYMDSVEMQKRMKQIHANGKRPSLEATDELGRPYMMRNGVYDTNMQYILLNDVLGNPSQYGNKEFMDTVAYTHGRYTKEYNTYIESHPELTELEKTAKAIQIGKKSSQYRTFAATSYTDGQGYRTLEGYRKIKAALGLWSENDEKCYKRILEIRNIHKSGTEWTYSEKLEVAQMAANWQPIKPFVYGMQTITLVTEGVGRVFRVPTLIKCSECLIIPELMPVQSKLRIIGKYLDDAKLDCAYYDSAVKVGAFGQAETMYTNNPDNDVKVDDKGYPIESAESGPFVSGLKQGLKAGLEFKLLTNEGLNKILRGGSQLNDEPFYKYASPAIHTISYEYYVELSAVPEHTYNSRTIGTQLRKIFYDGLNKYKLDKNGRPTKELIDYSNYINGKEITLPNGQKTKLDSKELLIKFYNSLHCANVLALFESIVNIIKNDRTLSLEFQKVAQQSTNELLTKLVMYAVHEVSKENGQSEYEFPLPLFENAIEHDAVATLISMFRKASTLLLILGGSLVQASAYGIDTIKYDESSNDYVDDALKAHCDKNGNILYYDCEVPFAQEYTDKFGKRVKLKFEEYCNPDGTLIYDSHTEIIDGTRVVIVDKIPRIEKHFPGSTEMICYRIPSEKDYSAAVLKVKRFTKPIEGGVIKLPVLITSITGADFDIDKMFLMRPLYVLRLDATTLDEFIKQTYKDEFLDKVWTEVYEGNYFGTSGAAIKEALAEERNNWMQKHGIVDERNLSPKERKQIPSYASFWDLAVEHNPDAFLGVTKDGSLYYYTDKQAFFEEAAQHVDPDFRRGVIKQFRKKDLFKWHTYDYDKPVDQQKRAKIKGVKTDVVVRNNMMLLLVKKRLQDPQTMISRTTPGGFKDAEDGAEDIRYTIYADKSYINGDTFDWERFEQLKKDNPDPNASLDYADPFTLVEYNKLNLIAAKLVGTFANLNSFVQMLNSLKDARLKKPINMFGRSVSSLVTGIDENRITDSRYAVNESSRNNVLFVAEMLAAAVDSVKNPTLKFLNITQSTAYVAGLMAMTGYTHREIGIFLNQPIVKEVTNYCELNNCGLDTAIKAILKLHYTVDGKPKTIQSENEYASNLTEGKLLERLVGGEEVNSIEVNLENAAFMNHLFSVLSALQHLTTASLALKSYVSASKMTSANSIQSTYGSLYSIVQAAENLNNTTKEDVLITLYPYSDNNGITNPIDTNLNIESENYMNDVLNTVFPIEQVIYDVVRKFIGKTQKFFPYDNPIYKSARDFFKNANRKDAVLLPKTIDAIHKYVLNWCLQNLPDTPTLFGDGVKGATIEVEGKFYTPKMYFLHKFPREFQKFLDAHVEEYPTMHRCLTLNENGKIELNYGFNRDSDKDAFTMEWRSMIENNRNEGNGRINIGTALYFYNFYASKFNFGTTTFDHLMPQDVLPDMIIGYEYDFDKKTVKPKTYKEALEQIKDSKTFDNIDDEFKIRFLIDNCNNNELVKQITNTNDATYFGNDDINITDSKVSEFFKDIKLRENKDGSVTYPLAIHVNDKIYIAINRDGEVLNTIYDGLDLIYRPYSTQVEDLSLKVNEENMPIEGTFLEPISWDKLSSVSSEDIAYDVINNMLDNTIEATRGTQIDIHEYLDFCKNVLTDIRGKGVSINSIYIVQKSFKKLHDAYEAFNSGIPISAEDRKMLLDVNASIILKSFVNVLCPGIKYLTGDLRAALYNDLIEHLMDDENTIRIGTKHINDCTIEDLKNKVVSYLQNNRLEIEDLSETNRRANTLFEILQDDDGETPLLPSENEEVQPPCRR